MKTLHVTAAAIRRGNQVFATQRGCGEMKDGWEFPGGKIEAGETAQEALQREIREELDTSVEVGSLIDTIQWDYPNFHLIMDVFWCTVKTGNLILREAENAKRLDAETLDSVDWLPADRTILEKVRAGLQEK
jgi:8-oxo-dGTP diphosphatase